MTNHQSPARVEARQASPLEASRDRRGAARVPYKPAGLELDRLLRMEICALAAQCQPHPRDLRFLFIDLQPHREKGATLVLAGLAIAYLATHPKLPSYGLAKLKAVLNAWFDSLDRSVDVGMRELFANETRSNADADIEQTEAFIVRSVPEIDQAINATTIAIAHSQKFLGGLLAERRRAATSALQSHLCGGVA